MTSYSTTRTAPGFTTIQTRSAHRCAQGFCTVCGSTWPCWRGSVGDAGVMGVSALSLGLPR